MSLLGIALFVLSGYLLSRAAVRHGLHHPPVRALVHSAAGHPDRAILAMLAASAGMSAILPNSLTILALLPVLSEVSSGLDRRTATLLGLSVIYGANIGGAASLTGTPANLYLLGTLHVLAVPGREHLSLGNWLVFGIPLAALLVPVAYLALLLAFPRQTFEALARAAHQAAQQMVEREFQDSGFRHRLVRLLIGLTLAHLTVLGLAGPATAGLAAPRAELLGVALTWPDLVMGFLLLANAAVLFAPWFSTEPAENSEPSGRRARRPILTLADLWHETPWKGLAAAALVAIFLFLLSELGASHLLEHLSQSLAQGAPRAWLAALGLIAVTIFGTEVLNNTTVATVLIPVAVAYAQATHSHPLALPVAVSMASTCAFMTPIATPVNALAAASLGRLDLKRMALAGLILNLAATLVLLVWSLWVLPHLL